MDERYGIKAKELKQGHFWPPTTQFKQQKMNYFSYFFFRTDWILHVDQTTETLFQNETEA